MVDTTKRGIAMVAAVSEALKVRKTLGDDSDEEIMRGVMPFLRKVEFKQYNVEMIAAVSHAIKLIQREPGLKDREVIDRIMREMSSITPSN